MYYNPYIRRAKKIQNKISPCELQNLYRIYKTFLKRKFIKIKFNYSKINKFYLKFMSRII